MNNPSLKLIVLIIILGSIPYAIMYYDYEKLTEEYNNLTVNYNSLVKDIFSRVQNGSTAVTVVYYTNFGKDRHIISISIPYEKYENYHDRPHPYWGGERFDLCK